ncbi:hypothetical protein BREVNS_1147 [Brevinematales bacterium NS]|nr:hypothetical protein BREVNS_1147 [Brevinematales bacterium NS]
MGSSLCPIIGQGGTFFAFPHLPTAGLLKKTLPNLFLFLALVFGITSAILWPFVHTLKHFFAFPPSLFSVIVFLTAWGIFMRNRKQSWLSVLGYPVIFLNLLFAAFYSLGKTGFGKGILWKERLVK